MPSPVPASSVILAPVRGRVLRHAVLVALDRRYGLPRTVTELLADLAELGVCPASARPGKALADAMRWEVRRGRAVRCGWGIYRLGHLSESTRRRARLAVRGAISPGGAASPAAPRARAVAGAGTGGSENEDGRPPPFSFTSQRIRSSARNHRRRRSPAS